MPVLSRGSEHEADEGERVKEERVCGDGKSERAQARRKSEVSLIEGIEGGPTGGSFSHIDHTTLPRYATVCR